MTYGSLKPPKSAERRPRAPITLTVMKPTSLDRWNVLSRLCTECHRKILSARISVNSTHIVMFELFLPGEGREVRGGDGGDGEDDMKAALAVLQPPPEVV